MSVTKSDNGQVYIRRTHYGKSFHVIIRLFPNSGFFLKDFIVNYDVQSTVLSNLKICFLQRFRLLSVTVSLFWFLGA